MGAPKLENGAMAKPVNIIIIRSVISINMTMVKKYGFV
jgi:hypothetical protein